MYSVFHSVERQTARDGHISLIASGFRYSSDARLTVANWVKRHHPLARYDGGSGRWRLESADGAVHSFYIEAVREDGADTDDVGASRRNETQAFVRA